MKKFALDFLVSFVACLHVNTWDVLVRIDSMRNSSAYWSDRRAFHCSAYLFFTGIFLGLLIEPQEEGIFRYIFPMSILISSYFFFCFKRRYLKVIENNNSRKKLKGYQTANFLSILYLISMPITIYLFTFKFIS